MNKTNEKIKKGIREGLNNIQIAKRLGRALDKELEDRINKFRVTTELLQ